VWDAYSDSTGIDNSELPSSYEYWMRIDPAGRLNTNPFCSSATRMEEYSDTFRHFEDARADMDVTALRTTLFWAVPAFICAAGAGYLLSCLVAGF